MSQQTKTYELERNDHNTFTIRGKENDVATELNYLTTAPTSANTSGTLKLVVLTSDPETKYAGYIYYIAGSST